MNKLITLSAFLISFSFFQLARSQGIYQYWGTASGGGDENQGTVFTTRSNGSGFKLRANTDVLVKGSNPDFQQPVLYNNKMYAVLRSGGINGSGILMSYDPVTETQTKLADMYTIGGESPIGSLLLYNNKLYGTCTNGGANGFGLLFEYDPATSGFVKKYDFDEPTGSSPEGHLIVYNNKFYGVTTVGGANNNAGTIYEFDPATNIYTVKKHMLTITGRWPYGGLAVHNGLMYGVCRMGGANNTGVLYEFDPATNNLIVRTVFGTNSGEEPQAGLVLYNNKFYAQTSKAGNNNAGTIYQFDPVSKVFTTLYHHTTLGGSFSQGKFTVYNNKFYGLLNSGGTESNGSLFEFDPATLVFTKKVNFSSSFGRFPNGAMTVYNNKMYGFTTEGGAASVAYQSGVMFEYDPAINGYQKKLEFRTSSGLTPVGNATYFNGKTYGLLREGGNNAKGGIWMYDMATHAYSVIYHFTESSGYPGFDEAMIVHNNKLYGTLFSGGVNGDGTLFEFDPATSTFTKKYDFILGDGASPCGQLVVHNNKFLGTTSSGGLAGGVIYEFDPATNNYAIKVHFSPAMGRFTRSGLTYLNGKYYGTTHTGGLNDKGVLFEYNPGPNSYIVRHHFDEATGSLPNSGVSVANNKLYGLTQDGGAQSIGVIFSFDPATSVYSLAHSLTTGNGAYPRTGMTFNEELQEFIGINSNGINFFSGQQGNIFRFDPATNDYNKTHSFVPATGTLPSNQRPERIPAMVAPGNPGNCSTGGSANVDATNANQWISFVNTNGDAVAEINPNGNILGRVNVEFYVHNGPTRADNNGTLYLDRNITITVDNQPASPVSVRLYIRKTEFDKLKATPGSMVNLPADLAVFKGNDVCQATVGGALKVGSLPGTWAADYVYSTSVTSFSTFYFASNSFTTLPVQILSFNGSSETAGNKLQWKASCTNDVEFILERSTDGNNFQPVDTIPANINDCNSSLSYVDMHPPAKAFYRLQIKEIGLAPKYSAVLLLNRNAADLLKIQVVPNPAGDGMAVLQIQSRQRTILRMNLVNATGQIIWTKSLAAEAGASVVPVNMSGLSKGIYHLVYTDGEHQQTVRIVRQ